MFDFARLPAQPEQTQLPAEMRTLASIVSLGLALSHAHLASLCQPNPADLGQTIHTERLGPAQPYGAVTKPRFPAAADVLNPPLDAGSAPVLQETSALLLARAETRPLAWRATVRLDTLIDGMMAPVGFDEASPAGSALAFSRSPAKASPPPPLHPAPAGDAAPVSVAAELVRPAEREVSFEIKTPGRMGGGIFIPQLRLGPLRPRITYGARVEPFAFDGGNAKGARRGAVIPISDLRGRESGEPSRIRGAQGGKGHR
jgi:hypothetical protein